MPKSNTKSFNSYIIYLAIGIITFGMIFFFMSRNNKSNKLVSTLNRKTIDLENKINQHDQMLRFAMNHIDQQKSVINQLQTILNSQQEKLNNLENSSESNLEQQQQQTEITPQYQLKQKLQEKKVVELQELHNSKFETESDLDKELENELNELNESKLERSVNEVSELNSKNENKEFSEVLSIEGQDSDDDDDDDDENKL